jgi:uncharacterized membrane protein YedE/YeeE
LELGAFIEHLAKGLLNNGDLFTDAKLSAEFSLPTKTDLDMKLIGGSAIFGIGWGMSGFCPGGLVPVLGLGLSGPLLTGAAIVAGILVARWITTLGSRPSPAQA